MNAQKIAEIVSRIDAIDASDPEAAHVQLDDILQQVAPLPIRVAAIRLRLRARWWAYA